MNFVSKVSTLLIFLTATTAGLSQVEFETTLSTSGYYSTEDELPFWMITNKNGALSSQTDGIFQGGTKVLYDYSENNKAKLSAGVSFFLRNGVEDRLQRDEVYIQFENTWLRAIVGAKNSEDRFQGLSVVDNNFLISGNARAIPGVLVETTKPISIFENFGIEGGIGHYELNDNRVTKNTMIHYKKLYINWGIGNKSTLRFGIEHYAQWGGTSPEFGKQKQAFSDFLNVFFAKNSLESTNDNERLNALGNHLGIYNLEYTYAPTIGEFKLYHQHPFEDGSGTALKNFPDGIWGFYYKPNQEDYTGFLKGIVLEYFQTVSQSGRFGRSGRDNYFNNGIYMTGWRYDKSIIGFPFFDNTSITQLIENNRIRGAHIGMLGSIKNIDLLGKISVSENFGSYSQPFSSKENRAYVFLKTTYNFEKLGKVSLEFGYDYNDEQNDKSGVGLSYSYTF
ncbi:hypothetical protein INR76_09880 [Marixanthomonas sp. SCSIO 43207]|uniref:capsule assembly Wzi family protein n=1 Tax=Marixanthomonas sp. SCSIO 43207 TaxID=2779360 RepID=UPI001CA9DD6F|nr:capsule assembly Wzi family protein [Marixanthomonas sp. SCSIO 43207]UAB80424.1 hypothetical protein INR76_09880 [Marixanthomonas sp. SCSIO 43207]